MNPVTYIPPSKRLLEQLREVLRYKNYSLKTGQAYLYRFASSSAGAAVMGGCGIRATWAQRR
jgi:hypothetical protein